MVVRYTSDGFRTLHPEIFPPSLGRSGDCSCRVPSVPDRFAERYAGYGHRPHRRWWEPALHADLEAGAAKGFPNSNSLFSEGRG